METNTKVITLLSEAKNVMIDKSLSNDEITSIVYDSPVWPQRKCIYHVPGVWEIKRVQKNIVSLKRIILKGDDIEFMPVKINVPLK